MPPNLLITAGPTHEPIDAVRYIGNRSSGRLGVALADAAAGRGMGVTLLLGPTAVEPADTRARVRRFRTTADLERLLGEELGRAGTLVMAAAVADYRPVGGGSEEKIRREAGGMTLRLEATPDLLARCGEEVARTGGGKTLVGFALEPRSRMRESAMEKLRRKKVDAIVANPLETMDAEGIEAEVFWRDGGSDATGGVMSKKEFAAWLLDVLGARGALR